MSKKQNQENIIFLNKLNSDMQKLELNFKKNVKDIIYDNKKNIVNIENGIKKETEKFFKQLQSFYEDSNNEKINAKFLENIKQEEEKTYAIFLKYKNYLYFLKEIKFEVDNSQEEIYPKVEDFIHNIFESETKILETLNLEYDSLVKEKEILENSHLNTIKRIKIFEFELQKKILNVIQINKNNIVTTNEKIEIITSDFINTLNSLGFEQKIANYESKTNWFASIKGVKSIAVAQLRKNENGLKFQNILKAYHQKYIQNHENLILISEKIIKEFSQKYWNEKLDIIKQEITNENNNFFFHDVTITIDEEGNIYVFKDTVTDVLTVAVKDDNEVFFDTQERTIDEKINEKLIPFKEQFSSSIKKFKENINAKNENKDNVQFFLNKEIISTQHKQEIAKNWNKKLQNMSKDDLKKEILEYFKNLKENFFNPFFEKIQTFDNNISILNLNYKNLIREIENTNSKDEQVIKSLKKEISQTFKNDREKALVTFENDNNFLLQKLDDLVNHNPQICKVFEEQLLIHENITNKEKEIYLNMLEKINTFVERIKKHKDETQKISNTFEELPDQLQKIEYNNSKVKINELLVAGIKNDNNTSFSTTSGEPLSIEELEKLKFLQGNLLFNNKKLNEIYNVIDKWKKEINNIFEAKENIKKLKIYKTMTTVNDREILSLKTKEKIITRKENLELNFFPDEMANTRAQYIIVAEKRKEEINKYLVLSNTKNHTFENTIDKILFSKKDKRMWEKFAYLIKKPVRWIGEATCINRTSNWLMPFLVLVSPVTLIYASIKSANRKLRQLVSPKIYLEDDIKLLNQFKKELDKKCDDINLKYAHLITIPLEKRSLFSTKKTDEYYLKKAEIEIKKAIFQFQLKCKPITNHYENFIKKQNNKYYSNGKTMKKIENISKYFENNNIKKSTNEESKYQFKNKEELDNVLRKRIKETDYKNLQPLSDNMKKIIEGANGLSDEIVAHIKNEDVHIFQIS